MPTSTVVPHTPTNDAPTAPTDQVSSSGRPTTRVPLPSALLDKINATAAKNLMPGTQVQGSDQKPIAKDESAQTTKVNPDPKTATVGERLAAHVEAGQGSQPVTQGTTTAPATPETAKSGQPAKKDGIAQVREALERAEARARELEGSLTATTKEKADAFTKAAELEAKVKGYDDRIAKEFEPQLKQLNEKAQRLQAVEEKLRVQNYTATDEWYQTIEKPITAVGEKVGTFLNGLFVRNGETGQDVPASMDHFNYVLAAPSKNSRLERAKAMFGEFSGEAMQYANEMETLIGNRKKALVDAQLKSAEYFKRQQEEQQAAQARFKQRVQERVSNYLVKPADNDPEESATLAKGVEFAEAVERGSNDPEVWADMVARVKAATGSRDLLELRNKRLVDELAQTKAQLAQYLKTDPDVTTGGSGSESARSAAATGSQELGKTGIHDALLARARSVAKGRV